VIHPIKSDHRLRPSKVRQGSWTHHVDFPDVSLSLCWDSWGTGPDRLLPGDGCRALCARVPFGLLAFGESPRGHEALHHGTLFELVFDRVCIVQTCHFEKFLKVLIRLPCQALGITLDGCEILHIRAVHFFVVVVAAGSNCDPLGHHFCPFCCLWRLS
jgi:hypothetical protein